MAMQSIHLINPLENAAGGSEWRTLMLYDLLRPHADVHLWTESKHDPRLPEHYPIESISMEERRFPCGGTFVFVGFYRQPGDWVCRSRSDRTIVIYNTPYPKAFVPMLRIISSLKSPIEIVYAAKWLRKLVGHPGPIQPSLIDLKKFSPPAHLSVERDQFCVGRLSRDHATKHHAPDIAMYREMANNGIHIRLMGGMLFQKQLRNTRGIELLPTCAKPADIFLKELNCFYYRTNENWVEPSGRVIMEAMATGLPVVAHQTGGYSEWITHGKNGFLFDTQQEAFELLLKLKRNPELCKAIGTAAREAMEETYSAEAKEEIVRFYLG